MQRYCARTAQVSLAAATPATPRRIALTPTSVERFYAEIDASTAMLAGLAGDADLALTVPTCPDWTLRQLITHVGRAHRWAAEITATRSAELIPFRSVPDGKLPGDPSQHGPWLRAGARRLIEAVREAGADPVWAFGGMVPASFWGRRMAHETLVHRVDAELATGRAVIIAPDLAADAIDEWLGFQTGPVLSRGDPRAQALPEGRVLHVHATDDGLDGTGEWLVRPAPSGVTVEPGHGKGDVALTGPAARLLLVLLRRLPPSDPAVEVFGDAGLLERWLAATPF
jgi:uncharacterized protein (TIGR03083 family)